MPGINGKELLKKITDLETALKCYSIGANELQRKPIEVDKIEKSIVRYNKFANYNYHKKRQKEKDYLLSFTGQTMCNQGLEIKERICKFL
jgi:hypothetical protein